MIELAVLVPVLNRPQNVKPLVKSWRRSKTPGELLLIATHGDDAEIEEGYRVARQRYDFTVLAGPEVTWPQKINCGVKHIADAEWYLCAADDIEITEGWWDATAELRADASVGVIGTSDSATGQGNPRVAAGDHTCHPLIRGSYIRDRGTIDEPGKAVHDGYHHWCVDDELVWTAKLRGAWAFCREAVLEHRHPYWGTAPVDDTYLLGEAHAQEDIALWRDRATRLLGLTLQ